MATKTTKRALLVSVLSLFICFTMLLGTTYAWFTDSVTSAGNIIKTGTLDVSLEYKTPMGISGDWVDASTGAIFNHDNWEPGYTQVRYVKIENKGSLDLKFILNIIPNTATAPGEVNLADVIEVYMMPVADATNLPAVDRTALTTSSTAYKGTLAAIMAEDDGAAHGVLYAKNNADAAANKNYVEVYAIVLKMSESAGNEYQNKSVGGGFVVQLLATQLASENDDLGTNDYDTNAAYPTVVKANVPAGTTTPTPIKAGKTTVKVPAGVDAGEYEVSVSNENVETDENDNVTVSFDIEVTKDGEKVGNGDYVVEKYIGENLNLTEVTHKGEVVNGAVYDPATGIVTFTVNSFSPFAITYYSGVIENAEDLANIAKGGNFVLGADIALENSIYLPADVNVYLDLNGKKIAAGEDGYVIENENGSKLVIADNSVSGEGEAIGIIYNGKDSETVVESGTFTAKNGGSYVFLNNSGSLTINGGVVNGGSSYPLYSYNDGHSLVVNDVVVNGKFGCINAYAAGTVEVNGGEFYMTGVQGQTSHLIYISGTTKATINDGIFKKIGDISMSNAGGGGICTMASAEIVINGGFFAGDYRDLYVWSSNSKITVHGGTFKFSPTSEGAKIADGFMSVAAGSGYTIIPNSWAKVSTAAELMAAISNGASTIWIVEGADLTGFQRTVINKSLTIYGNGASLTADEDFAIEFHNGAQYPFADDVTLTIYDLNDVCVWGSRCSEYAFNLNLNNCDDCRIFVMGTTGANNIYMNDCDVTRGGIGQDTAIYSNSNGSIVVENCTFTGIECVFNLNHKVAGEMGVTVTGCDFIDCATTGTATYYAPVRLCNSVAEATQTLNVSGCTFVYTAGKAAVNGADVLLNADGSAAGIITANVQSDAVVKNGENGTFN